MWEWNDYANLSDEELKHYGILGMKWGTHRAKIFGNPESNSKKIAKAYNLTLKADKIQAKRAKAKARVDRLLAKRNRFERGLNEINIMRDKIK